MNILTPLRYCRGHRGSELCGRALVTGHAPLPVGLYRHAGRNLCNACYKRYRKNGDLLDHERVTRPAEMVVEEYRRLTGAGHSLTEVAARLGIQRDSVRMALIRHRRRAAT